MCVGGDHVAHLPAADAVGLVLRGAMVLHGWGLSRRASDTRGRLRSVKEMAYSDGGDYGPVRRYTYVAPQADLNHSSTGRVGWQKVMPPWHPQTRPEKALGRPERSVDIDQVLTVLNGSMEMVDILQLVLRSVDECHTCKGTGLVEGTMCSCRARAKALLGQLPGWAADARRRLGVSDR